MESKEQTLQKAHDKIELKAVEESAVAPGLQIGDKAPEFCLQNANDDTICLSDLLKKGPVILSFYRGDWCEFCSKELEGYHGIQNEILTSGGTLVAISPQDLSHAKKLASRMDLNFQVVSDPKQKVIQKYKLQFSLSSKLRVIYKEKLGIDLAKENADHSWHLPIPATYVIDTKGIIRSRFVSMDYQHRMKPKEALLTLDAFTYFQSIFHNAPLAMIVVNNDSIIIDHNESAIDMFSFLDGESPIGLNAYDRLLENTPGMAELINDIIKGKKISGKQTGDLRFLPNKHQVVNFSANALVLKGQRLGVVCICEDITDKIERETQLNESRQSLARAQKIANIGDWTWDMRSEVVTWSDQMYRLFGLTPGEKPPEHEGYLKFVHPDDVEDHISNFETNYKNNSLQDTEYRIINTKGEVRYVHTIAEFEQDDKGNNIFMHGVTIDITPQALQKIKLHETLTRLTDQEKKYRNLVETMNEGLLTLDKGGNFLYANNKSVELLGYPIGELIGKPAIEFMRKEKNRNQFVESLSRANTGKHLPDIVVDNEFIKKDKTILYARISARYNFDDNGNFTGLTTVVTDIAALKKTQEMMNLAKQQAETANRTKSEFLSSMSHEIRTPMNAILGFTEILGGMVHDDTIKEYVSSIASSGKILLNLINDILDLSKVEAGKLRIEKEPVRLEYVFQDIQQIFMQKLREKGLEIKVDIDPNLPQKVLLDETRLRQVMINLIGNAIKFTDDGFIKIIIKRQNDSQNDRGEFTSDLNSQKSKKTKISNTKYLDLYIGVEDTGIGIPQDQQQLIFDAFVQREGQNNKEYGGTGLGLAITNRLVDLMGGKISLKSKQGAGSLFFVVFENVEITDKQVAENKLMTLVKSSSINFAKGVILVADDIKSNRDLIRGYLRGTRLNIIEAENGKQAVDVARSEKLDLILMDMKMPVLSGYDAAAKIKADEKTKNIPLIAVTASTIVRNKDDIRKVTDDLLRKPFNKDQLFQLFIKYLAYNQEDSNDEMSNTVVEPEMDLSDDTIRELPKLIKLLEGELFLRWQSVSDGIIINDINEFASEIEKSSEEYKYPPLQGWAKKLLKYASVYDTEGISSTLKKFPAEIEMMKGVSID